MIGLNSGGRTGNRHKTIHSGSTFVRIKCLANSMRLTKKSFLLRIFLSSHSFPAGSSSPNSFHSHLPSILSVDTILVLSRLVILSLVSYPYSICPYETIHAYNLLHS